MKISLLTQYYKPEIGAPQNRLYEMCIGLKKKGTNISVITGMPNYPTGKIFEKYKGLLGSKEILDGIEVQRYWLYASNAKKIIPRIWNMVSFSLTSLLSYFHLKKRKNDFIIVESPPLLLGITGYILAKLTCAKLIINVSDLWPLSAKELGVINENGLIYKGLEKIEAFLYKKSIVCIGQSQEIVNYMAEHGAAQTYLFRNGVNPDRFANITSSTDNSSPLKIVYAGLLGYAQGILDICRKVDFNQIGAEFHIYGAGGEQMAIEELIQRQSYKGIYYHGKVKSDDIPAILANSDCTLIPLVKNIYGAVPSKIYESMAAGRPIIFSGLGEGRQIIEENCLGWVSMPRDYKQLSDIIKYISFHRHELEQKGINCRQCARNKFNRPRQVENLYNYLTSLLIHN